MGYISIKLCILLSALVTASHQLINYRLPNDSKPRHYKLKIIPHIIPGNFTFNGESEVSLEILNETKNLTLHSLDLNIHEESTILSGINGTFVPKQHIFEEETQFLILNFDQDLQTGNYTLRLKFTGLLNDNYTGFFLDSYVNDNNETIYLVATQFEPTFARRAFPCWDEPALKATFDISIKHFSNLTSLSNMPVKKVIKESEIDGKIWTNFETTPLMSTYIVCFTVSDFVNYTNPHGNFSIWSRKNAIDSMSLAYIVGIRAISLFEEYTGILYEFPKLDIFAIPNFNHGGMENWGLIIIQENFILRNTTPEVIEKVLPPVMLILHEVSHQWFGDLVSPAWWKHIWISEGLATYLQYFLSDKEIDFPPVKDTLMVLCNEIAFNISEESVNSDTVFRNVNSTNDILSFYGFIHSKAAAMMKMLSGLLSEQVFHTGVKRFLQKYQFKTISTDDFWVIIEEARKELKLPHSNFNIKEVMESHLSQIGYPVINVIRDYSTGSIKVTQECVFQKTFGCLSKWWIPINFATSSSPDFISTIPTHWMNPDEKDLIIEGIDPKDWVIFNIQGTAHYRVNYDKRNWFKIADYLKSDNYSNIHVINRDRLRNDATWLYIRHKNDRDYLSDIPKRDDIPL